MIHIDELGARVILSLADGKLNISESTLFGLIIAVFLSVLGIWLGSGLKKKPRGKQVIAEFIVGWVYKFTRNTMGEENEKYAPYVGTLLAFIFMASSLGLFGIRPITADLNVTFALSGMTFILIQYSGIKAHGIKGKLQEMCDPYPVMFPLKVIEEVTLPVSLSLRLFGNILGGLIVVELWMHFMEFLSSLICDIPFLRAVTVLPPNAFFDIFEPAIQTYIFTMLTMVFLQSAVAMMPSKHHNK